jgi:DNA-binding NarL/FixJ family response regulator
VRCRGWPDIPPWPPCGIIVVFSRLFSVIESQSAPHEDAGLQAGGPIRVLIADDHEVVAEGVRCMLAREDGIVVVGSARNGREAVDQALEESPDVVLMDHLMPELNGIEAASMIRQRTPSTAIVMLSTIADPHHVVRALRAGVSAYVPKHGNLRDVVQAIRDVVAGRRYLHPEIADAVLNILMRGEASDAVSTLSPRERQVLQLIAEGHTNPEIAARLSLSPRSVETYRGRMMGKLEVHDIAGLVRFAIRHGISPLD